MKKVDQLYIKIGVGLVLIISLLTNFKQCSNIKIANQNITALSDTLKLTKNKVGEVVKSKTLLLMDITNLKNSNSDLTTEINKLTSKDKKNLIEIDKLNIVINMQKDSLEKFKSGTPIVINDSTKVYPFNKINAFRDLEWNVEVVGKQINSVSSTLLSDKVMLDLVINKKKIDNNIILSVSSSNPYVNITNIDGSIIDLKAYNSLQKIKPFSVGLQLGYGLSTNNGIVFISPYVGIGISYNLFRF
jgi:hypothetical protein